MKDEEKAEQYVKENGKVYYHSNGELMFTREEEHKMKLAEATKNYWAKKDNSVDYNFPKFERSELIDTSQTQIFK